MRFTKILGAMDKDCYNKSLPLFEIAHSLEKFELRSLSSPDFSGFKESCRLTSPALAEKTERSQCACVSCLSHLIQQLTCQAADLNATASFGIGVSLNRENMTVSLAFDII